MDTPAEYVALYVGLSVAYALSGYFKNVLSDPEVGFSPRKFTKTLAVGVVAGGIMASQGEEASFGAVEGAMAIAIPVVNQVLSGLSEYHGGAPDSTE